MRANSTPNFEKNIQNQLLCPLSGRLMRNPVIATDGYTYEKEYIEQWFTDQGMPAISPMTGAILLHHALLPNHTLKKVVEAYLKEADVSQYLAQVSNSVQQTEMLRTERAGLFLIRGRLRQLAHKAVGSSRLMEQSEDIAHRRAVLQKGFGDRKMSALRLYTQEVEDAEQALQVDLNDIKVKIQMANEREDDEAVRRLIDQRQEVRKKYEQSKTTRVSQYEHQLKKMEVEYQMSDSELSTAQRQIGAAKAGKIRLLEGFARRIEQLDTALQTQTQLVREGYQECQAGGREVLCYLEQRAAFFVPRAVTNTLLEKRVAVFRVHPPIAPQQAQTFLTAVYRGEVDTVDRLLKTTSHLVYAEGDLIDLSKRHFTRITGFQYAVWALDEPMWKVILKYLSREEAAAQRKMYTARQDLIAVHGLQYRFEPLLKEYDAFLKNWNSWSWDQRDAHWVKQIGAEQAKMPSWLIYAFTERGENVMWVKMDVTREYLRSMSDEFKEFQRIISKGGHAWFRGTRERSIVSGRTYAAEIFISHDSMMMEHLKARSLTQYNELVNQLNTQSPLHGASFSPSRLGQ